MSGPRIAFLLALAALTPGCTGCAGKADGLECASAAECQQGRVCAAGFDGRTRCMLPCAADTFLCDDGSVCVDATDGRLCWFGGRTPYRDPCVDPLECEAGTLCIAAEGRCEQACEVEDDRICPSADRCVPLPGATAEGYCQALPDAGPDAGADAGVDASVTTP